MNPELLPVRRCPFGTLLSKNYVVGDVLNVVSLSFTSRSTPLAQDMAIFWVRGGRLLEKGQLDG